MTLDDDIARIARLRGRDPANYQRTPQKRDAEHVAFKLGPERVRSAFALPKDWMSEQFVYDALPLASRVFIREAPIAISAIKWSELLEANDLDQESLISLFREVIPLRVEDVVRRRYGPTHPQAGGQQ